MALPCRMILLVALSATASATAAAAAEASHSALVGVIDHMHRRGELTAEQASHLVRFAREHPERAPSPAVRSNTRSRCRNPEFRAIRHWIHTQGIDTPPPPPPPSTGHVASASRPLRVFYQSEDQLGMAGKVLSAAEDAWQKQVIEAGYPAPFTTDDPSVPPVPGLDLYLGDTGMGGGGRTEWLNDIPSTPQADCSARVLIDSQNPEEFIAATVAHEFNHATQMATDCVEVISAWENFATSVEHYYFPDDVVIPYFVEVFQSYPEYPIDYWKNVFGDSDLIYYQYGASLFPTFLRERFSPGNLTFLREAWASFAQPGTLSCGVIKCFSDQPNEPDWFSGLESLLQANGSSFDEAFDEFSAWRAITGSRDDGFHFEAGASITDISTAATHYLKQGAAKGTFDVREYGSRYIELKTDGYTGPVHVQVSVDTAATWSASVLSWRNAEPVERVIVSFEAGHGELYLESTLGVQRIMLVVSQHKDATHLPGEKEYSTQRGFDYVVDDDTAPDAGAEPEPLAEAGAEAAPDATVDAKHETAGDASHDAAGDARDAALDVEPQAAWIEAGIGGGGCNCRAAGSGSRTLSGADVAALGVLLAILRSRTRR